MTQPRIIPPDEAREWQREATHQRHSTLADDRICDLGHTAVVRGEQREAALALHQPRSVWPDRRCLICVDPDGDRLRYPCPTARALGVTE